MTVLMLSGCATTIKTDLKNTIATSRQVVLACSDPAISVLGSPAAARNDFESKVVGLLGFAKTPSSDSIHFSIPRDISNLKASLVVLEDTKKNTGEYKKFSAAVDKLRQDSKEASTSLNTELASIRTDANQCQDTTGAGCLLKIDTILLNLAGSVQDDVSTLKEDFSNIQKTMAALEPLIAPNEASTIKASWTNLKTDIEISFQEIENILEFKADSEVTKQVTFLLEDDLNKYASIEVTNFLMNELDRVARKAEVKLDEIDQKTWFILSWLEFLSGPDIAQALEKEFEKAIPESTEYKNEAGSIQLVKTQNAISTQTIYEKYKPMRYLLPAAVASSCNRLSRDASLVPSDEARAEALMYPVFVAIITAYYDAKAANNPSGAKPQPEINATAATAALQGLQAMRAKIVEDPTINKTNLNKEMKKKFESQQKN